MFTSERTAAPRPPGNGGVSTSNASGLFGSTARAACAAHLLRCTEHRADIQFCRRLEREGVPAAPLGITTASNSSDRRCTSSKMPITVKPCPR